MNIFLFNYISVAVIACFASFYSFQALTKNFVAVFKWLLKDDQLISA